jgi:transaldolase
MSDVNYLQWLSGETKTSWWHDSGDPKQLQEALQNGAVGVTTNPVLCAQALKDNKDHWRAEIRQVLETEKDPRGKVEALMRIVVLNAARAVEPIFTKTGGEQGYVCAQVDPAHAMDRQAMYETAKRYVTWAPNISVKLPGTSAGIDVMERICSEGISVTITVSFTVPQVFATARRYQKVVQEAKGKRVGRCFPVIMIGRLDDYLRDVIADSREPISEQELQMAGLSVAKEAFRLFKENGFDATLLVAALRGNYHMTELAGADLIMSIHPKYQASLLDGTVARKPGIDNPIPAHVQGKLMRLPEFRKGFERDGMQENELIAFGLTQRTLAQFTDTGWRLLELFQL